MLYIRSSFNHSETTLKRHLEARLNGSVSISFTDNTSSMFSVHVRHKFLHICQHRMFLNADNPVLDESGFYLKTRRSKMHRFRKFASDSLGRIVSKSPIKVSIKTQEIFIIFAHCIMKLTENILKAQSVRRSPEILEVFAMRIEIGRSGGTANDVTQSESIPCSTSGRFPAKLLLPSCATKCCMPLWASHKRGKEKASTQGNSGKEKSFLRITRR